MNTNLNPRDALALVPDWDVDATEIQRLDGGLSNLTYRVRSGGKDCVLRLATVHANKDRTIRPVEVSILNEAARVELGPQPIFVNEEYGVLLTEYMDGVVWRDEDIRRTPNIKALAALLRRVHTLPPSGERFNLPLAADQYQRQLARAGFRHALIRRCVDIIEETPSCNTAVCCHNDVVAANVIEANKLKLIDWEYASDNDPLFDLASVIGYHRFDERRIRILLSAYSGRFDDELRKNLAQQERVFNAIHWLWLACRVAGSANDARAAELDALQHKIDAEK